MVLPFESYIELEEVEDYIMYYILYVMYLEDYIGIVGFRV